MAASGFAPQGHFDIKGMAVQAAVFRRAIAQMMGGVKGEFLGNLDHSASDGQAIGHGKPAYRVLPSPSRINKKRG